eukprot:TRINITY_DN5438_c0_g1_i1.p1 TRINITY_DN5438_c0_g1~~TRINITY_DN5438_c0_g1_i1.p1  ORF type:complete len:329 (-),score=55.60 TRINITY_DN5438_c0_g1_i1:18-1004(-)
MYKKILGIIVVLVGVLIVSIGYSSTVKLTNMTTKHVDVDLYGATALVLGATSGIGKGIAVRLAQAGANTISVGRNDLKGKVLLQQLVNVSKPTQKHEFYQTDLSMISNVNKLANDIIATTDRLDYIVLSQGVFQLSEIRTSEDLDIKLALHYYSRMAILNNLLPLLEKTHKNHDDTTDIRVLSVLSGGIHSVYGGVFEDTGLRENYSLINAANLAGYYNDLALDVFASKANFIGVVHTSPGFVDTSLGSNLGGVLQWVFKGLSTFFAKSIEECAEFMFEGLVGEEFKASGRVMIMDQYGGVGSLTNGHTDEAKKVVWEHTMEVFDRLK